MNLSELAEGRKDLEIALRARRATAAAFATGYSLLFLTIVLVPYRRGDVWACGPSGRDARDDRYHSHAGLGIGTNLGLGAATIPLAVGVVAFSWMPAG